MTGEHCAKEGTVKLFLAFLDSLGDCSTAKGPVKASE
jgi:hypothetical protein